MKFIENLPLFLLRPLAKAVGNPSMARHILALRYRRWTGRTIDWNHPANLQEYILAQLMDAAADPARLELYATLADKVAVRRYAATRAPGLRTPALLGSWRRPEEIGWESLPEKFAMKTNNGCGTNLIVRDKSAIDTAAETRRLRRWLRFPYGELSGQIHYSRIEPLIFAEELLEPAPGTDKLPLDYKFFCFNGRPRFILYYEERKVNGHLTPNMAFDLDWQPMEVVNHPTGHTVPPPCIAARNDTGRREAERRAPLRPRGLLRRRRPRPPWRDNNDTRCLDQLYPRIPGKGPRLHQALTPAPCRHSMYIPAPCIVYSPYIPPCRFPSSANFILQNG